MMLPKISIITPSYNSEAYIEQTIDSVLSQDYKALEYVVIDGGSTDGTVDIIKKYQKHFTYWVSEPDRGQSHAINKGLRLATGDIVNWLNADDYYEPDALKIVSSAFEDPQVRAFCGRSRIFNDLGTIKYSKGSDVYVNNLAKTVGMARIDQPETFFHREAWQKVGFLNENLHYNMDKEWWIRFLFQYPNHQIKSSTQLLVNFRYHSESKTVSQQDGFINEGLQLYLQLAADVNHTTFIELVETSFDVKLNKSLDIHFNTIDPSIVKSALNYTLLYLADYLYYHSKYKEFNNVFLGIEKALLTEQEIAKYKSLKFRTSCILQLIRKAFKRND